MLRDEVTVEVRDRNLERKGTITTKNLSLKATIRHLGVGEWELTLPRQHPMIDHLLTVGSGIIVSLRGSTLFSGVTTRPRRDTNLQNPDGTYTFKGVTDDVLLLDGLAFPSPDIADPGAQTESNDVQTGNAETLMRHYVSANICNGIAPVSRTEGFRQYLRLATSNENRGITLTKAPRFQNLMELLYEIGIGADLGFQVIQRDNDLVFEVLTLADRSDLVRLDIKNGTITSEASEVSAPSITRAIVAGQGEGVERMIIERTSTSSAQSETDWGRVIEQFIDQRNAAEMVELEQSGDERLIAGQLATTAIKIVPSDDQTMIYGADWEVGDTIAVVIDGIEAKTTVTAMTMIVNDQIAAIGAAIGDITEFDSSAALVKRVETIESRTANLERSEATGGGGGGSSTFVGDVAPSVTAGYQYWFKSSTGELFFLYTDADSTQWVQLNNGTVADAALTARVTSVESRSTSLETRATALETGVRAVSFGGTGASSLTSGGYLKGNGTSAVASQTGIPATDITSGALAVARMPAGSVLKVQYYQHSGTNYFASTGLVDLHSGLRLSFTPTMANSTIIIMGSMNFLQEGGHRQVTRCFRDSGQTSTVGYDVWFSTAISYGWTSAIMSQVWQDTAGNTPGVAKVYSFKGASSANNIYYNYNFDGQPGTSTYVIMEVAAL